MRKRRQRLSWYAQEKMAARSRRKQADPYSINQDHRQPAHDAYQNGDPSSWAEGVHRDLPNDIENGRNEVGLPNLSERNFTHKNVDAWGTEQAYDNADTFTAEDLAWGQGRREASRKVFANIEKKAFQCVRIAAELLPEAGDEEIEDQAFDLMGLPDDVVVATALRIAAHKMAEEDEEEDEDKEVEAMLRAMIAAEEAEEEAEEEEDAETKVEAMLRRMLAAEEAEKAEEAEEADEDEELEVEASDDEEEEAEEDSKVEAMLRRILAAVTKNAEEAEEAEEADEDDEDEEAEEDSKVEAMLRRMLAAEEDEDEADEDEEDEEDDDDDKEVEASDDEEDFDVEMDPTLDVVTSNFDQNDEVLRDLFANTVPKGAKRKRKAATTSRTNARGVQSLGGRVKEAANGEGDVDLSKLWASEPDVSDIF